MGKNKRKRKIKIILVIVTFFVFTILSVAMGYAVAYFKHKSKVTNNEKEAEILPAEYRATLVMVGDALIHSSVYNDAHRLANYQGYDFKPQISLIKEKVKDYDIAYYNQETILGGTGLGLSNYPRFNSPFEFGDAMVDAGFNLVSLATNHTVDKNRQGVLNSREYWNKQTGVQAVGSYSSYSEKEEIEGRILEVNNIKYALLNYTYGTNGIPVSDSYLVNVWPTSGYSDLSRDYAYQAYKETVKSDIDKLRSKVDVLMVAMHWGVEYTHTPTNYERDMAKFLADSGVDIVIGAHPHVIQPVEFIDDTLVIYSLGNFISSQYQNADTCYNYRCVVGLMSSLTITKTVLGNDINIKVDNINNELIYTYYTNWSNYLVIPFSNPEIKNYLYGYENVYNTYAKVIETDDERIKTVPLAS